MSSATRRGLGRGLASLIPDSAFDAEEGNHSGTPFRMVPIDEIVPNPEQPRRTFDREALEDLASSLKRHGVLSPLVARKHEGRYILIAGERRLRAAGLAGLHEVPVVVRDAEAPAEQLELALVENLQRADLDPIESALGYERLVQLYGYTQEEVATRVGKNRATVANALRLLKLPEFVQLAVRDGRLTAGHARALVPVEDEDQLRELVARILAQQLSVRATERLVATATRRDPVIAQGEARRRERTYDYATRLLSEALRTSVQIRPLKKGGGRIVIDYAGAEDLERLITQLRD